MVQNETDTSLKKGRSASIYLTCGGATRSVKEWATYRAQDEGGSNPELATRRFENSIRKRLRDRHKSDLTDAQVVYGFYYVAPETLPLEMGLPHLFRQWVRDAQNQVADQVIDILAQKMAAHFYKVLHETVSETLTEQGAKVVTDAATEKLVSGNFTLPSDDLKGTVQLCREYLNSIGEGDAPTMFGDTMAELMAVYAYDEGEGLDLAEMYQSALKEIKAGEDFEAKKAETLKTRTIPAPLSVRDESLIRFTRKQDSLFQCYPVFLLYEELGSALPLPIDAPNQRIPDPEQDAYLRKPWVRAFTQGEFGMESKMVVSDRMLVTYQEYWYLQHNEAAVRHDRWSPGIQRFMSYLLWDIGYRCLLGVTDHITFNTAMEIYYMGYLLAYRRMQLTPEVVGEMLERFDELEYSPFDAVLIATIQTLCPTRSAVDRDSPGVEQQVSALETYLAKHTPADSLFAFKAYVCAHWPDGMEQQYLHLSDDGEFNDVIDMRYFATNYGRNMAHWPKDSEVAVELMNNLPDAKYWPCELYFDATKAQDFTVCDGAPLIANGTHTYINL